MERLTEKSVGCFEYALKDHKAVPGEFGTNDEAISALRKQDHFREVTKKVDPLTNAQKIRSMSDEELAGFLSFNGDVEYCHAGMCKAGETCRICCLKWLQMPAEEDDHDA